MRPNDELTSWLRIIAAAAIIGAGFWLWFFNELVKNIGLTVWDLLG